MSQLLSLIQSEPKSRDPSGSAYLPSEPILTQNPNSAFARPVTIKPSKKKHKTSKSPASTKNPTSTSRSPQKRSFSNLNRSLSSQSGCSVCDNEKRRSRSRSLSKKSSKTSKSKSPQRRLSFKKNADFLEELLDTVKSPNQSGCLFNADNKSSLFGTTTQPQQQQQLDQQTLFDKYLVRS